MPKPFASSPLRLSVVDRGVSESSFGDALWEMGRLLDAGVFMGEASGVVPDEWQVEFLESSARNILVLCSRQVGKTEAVAVKALRKALYRGGSLVLVISPTQRQSQELLSRIPVMLGRLRKPLVTEVRDITQTRLVFENGSRILSLPGTEANVRGYAAPELIIVDEASRVPDAMYAALRPMMATNPRSQFCALTTPWGKRGWFYREWMLGGDAWARFEVSAEEVPRISEEFLAGELERLGEWQFMQEYMCKFMEAFGAALSAEAVERAFGLEEVDDVEVDDSVSGVDDGGVKPLVIDR